MPLDIWLDAELASFLYCENVWKWNENTLRLKSALFKFEVILNILRNLDISRDPFLSHMSFYIFWKIDTSLALLSMLWLTAKFCLPVRIYRFVFWRTWLMTIQNFFCSNFHRNSCILFRSRWQRFVPLYKPSYIRRYSIFHSARALTGQGLLFT
jgi:hypothetical protein